MRTWAILLGVGIISFSLMGCSRVIDKSESIGTWIPDKDSQVIIKESEKCKIVLQADGNFEATVPDYLLNTSDRSSGKLKSGIGTWSFKKGSKWTLENSKIELLFSEVDGLKIHWGSGSLEIESTSGSVSLFFYLGEAGGDRFTFVRYK